MEKPTYATMCSEIYFSASPLHMFRAAHTPITRSTILTVSTAIGTIHSRSQIVSVTSSQRSLARTCQATLRGSNRVYRPKHVQWTCREINFTAHCRICWLFHRIIINKLLPHRKHSACPLRRPPVYGRVGG